MKKLLVFVFAVLLLGSCSKNTEGCTDPNAINFNPDAVEDSGNCLFTLVGTWEGISWIPNGNNIIQNYDGFTLHCYSDSTWNSHTLPNWNGNNYADYRGTYFINNNHTECTFTTTHFNLNNGNGWLDYGPATPINHFSMELTHSSYSGNLISSTDTTLNSFDFTFVRVE